jgi:glycosyltransferase involved in cell wall biosynthesis
MKPTILVIENSNDVTGAFNSVLRSSIFLKEKYSFVFVVPRKSVVKRLLDRNGFVALELSMVEIRKNVINIVLYLPALCWNTLRLFRIIKQHNINLIHSNDFYNLIPACYRFLGGRIKYVCHVRFLPNRFPFLLRSVLYFFHLQLADAIIGVSLAVNEQLPKITKVICIYDGLPFPDTTAYESPKAKTLLYISNYIPGKGQEYALEGFARIAKKYPDWKLLYFGSDMGLNKNRKFKKNLADTVVSLGLTNSVNLNGFANDTSLLYRNATIVLNFSDSESFSLTCLEAQYYGRVVIATKCGGPEEIILDGVTGLLVERKNMEQISDSLEFLMGDLGSSEKMGNEAYRRVREKFSAQETYYRLSQRYTQILDEN